MKALQLTHFNYLLRKLFNNFILCEWFRENACSMNFYCTCVLYEINTYTNCFYCQKCSNKKTNFVFEQLFDIILKKKCDVNFN